LLDNGIEFMCRKSVWGDLSRNVLLCVLTLSCFLASGEAAANAAVSAEDCLACHADVKRNIQNKLYIHRPVSKADCKYCHVAIDKGGAKAEDAFLDKVKWVARGGNPGREHWLEIANTQRGATLVVETRSGSSLKVMEFPLPAFDELAELPSGSPLPPKIIDVRLLEVTKGVFVSASIAWETDSPADSQVFYGSDRLDQSSMLDRQMVTNHVVILTAVKPGKTYKYKVVSVDENGGRSESAIKSAVIDAVGAVSQAQAGQPGEFEPKLKVRAYRRGNKCLVIVSAEQAVSVRLGILPKKYADDNLGEGPTVIRHLPLNTPAVTNIGICYACHDEYRKILSHPINVYPKRGMVIPPEYATLPDGRITCMSCHATHASNIEFRLIKASKEALCRGCHRDIQ